MAERKVAAAVAPGQVGEQLGVLLVELEVPEDVAEPVVELLDPARRTASSVAGSRPNHVEPSCGTALPDRRASASSSSSASAAGRDPLDGVDGRCDCPLAAVTVAFSTPGVDPPSLGGSGPAGPTTWGYGRQHDRPPEDRRPAPKAQRTDNQLPEGATMDDPSRHHPRDRPRHLADPEPRRRRPGVFLPVNSMVIRGERARSSSTPAPPSTASSGSRRCSRVVEPEDVRWIFLSHDDGDHTGGLLDAARACPNATLVDQLLHHRAPRPGEAAAAPRADELASSPGDSLRRRRPHACTCSSRRSSTARPPVASTTRRPACCGRSTRSPASPPAPSTTSRTCRRSSYDETFLLFNSLVSPWHQWLDPVRYRATSTPSRRWSPCAIATAHGPILTGDAIHDAFDRVRALAGKPIIAPPGQEPLDEILAAVIEAPAA